MSIADFYESGEQKQNKAHLENLISIALANGSIADSEKELLKKFARRLSIDDQTFNEMLKGAHHYSLNPPVDKESRYRRLYNLVRICLVDGNVDEAENHLMTKYAIGLGYSHDTAEELISKTLTFVSSGIDFETAFEQI